MEERRGGYRVLVGKPEGRKLLARTGRRWVDDIKIVLREVGWGYGLDRSGSGYGQVARSCKCNNEISGFIKCGKFLD
jgi:hypothetical protein